MSRKSALYTGTVVHRRFGAKSHALRYRLTMALLDLDELDDLDRGLRLFSRNRFNLFSMFDRDYLRPPPLPAGGDGGAPSLKSQIETHLARAGIAISGGSIQLLALPRVLGYAFNPLTVYFCRRADGALVAILYDVRNTFGERHGYLIPVAPTHEGPILQSCEKCFHVSPFMDMDMTYRFTIVPPGAALSVGIDGWQDGERVIAACFAGTRRRLTDRQLLRVFLAHPLLGLAAIAGIHWEALKLWLKGVNLRARPAPPTNSVSIIANKEG
ncbi:MAG: DUF1365 family protein [Beijerinckiaceae bacterium]|nr:DUF1365 family protein [Beijerinckiaceae bacterium]